MRRKGQKSWKKELSACCATRGTTEEEEEEEERDFSFQRLGLKTPTAARRMKRCSVKEGRKSGGGGSL